MRSPRSGRTPSLQDVIGEAAFILSSPRRFLLEIALPPVGEGVVRHSTALRDPLTRFRNTSAYIYLIAFGTEEERRRIVHFVNRAHGPVRSDSYNAFDPHQQLWVASCMWYGGRDIYERIFGALDPVAAEELYREFSTYGTSLQVPPELWPADIAAFEKYWQTTIDGLVVDERVRTFAHRLLAGGDAPLPVRAAMPVNRFLTVGLLPPQLREAYGFTWTDRQQKWFDRLWAVAAPTYRVLPGTVRQLPKRLVLRDARARIARANL